MLKVTNLYCERQRRILFDALSFSLSPGEILQVGGANGTGKTTLLRIVAGLLNDYEGDIDWDLATWPLFLGHRPGVKDALTPLENLRWLASLMGVRADDRKLGDALEQMGLAGFESVRCESLSEGQRKRVSLARLCFSPAAAWVLDEPFSAIDAAGVAGLTQRLQDHASNGGVVLLTTHQPLDRGVDVRSLVLGET